MPAKTGSRNRIKPRFWKGYRRNVVSARKGIDTMRIQTNLANILNGRNGVLARKGIDTLHRFPMPTSLL